MAWYVGYNNRDVGYNNRDVGYNVGYRPYYERDNFRRPYYDAAPVMYRRPEPYFENYRRDYREGPAYADGRFGVLPMEEVFSREEAPQWMDEGYRHGRELRGYGTDRYDHHDGQNYGHGNFLHPEDDYERRDHRHHGDHHSSRREVELYVPICCDKCERKLRKHLEYLEGVETITTDQTTNKVVVFGHVNPSHVLNRARRDKRESNFWHPRYR